MCSLSSLKFFLRSIIIDKYDDDLTETCQSDNQIQTCLISQISQCNNNDVLCLTRSKQLISYFRYTSGQSPPSPDTVISPIWWSSQTVNITPSSPLLMASHHARARPPPQPGSGDGRALGCHGPGTEEDSGTKPSSSSASFLADNCHQSIVTTFSRS